MKRKLFSLFLLATTGSVYAQQALQNTGNLQIHSGASVTGFGSFTNTSAGILVNNGDLFIKGDISNSQASMATGTGTLYLNGSAAQTVSGTQAFKTFDFFSNNAAGITINNNLSVSGAHTFSSGIITTSVTPNYLIYEAGSSYSGDGDTRHVNGWVKKIGSTNFIFPLGNGTVERTTALSGLSASSEFNAKYFASTPFTTQMQSPIWEVDPAEYWSINKISGGTASVTLNWDYSKVYFPNWIIPDVQVAGYNGSLWLSNGGTASGTAATTGTITSTSISSFNLFTFGSSSYILPLTLISFTANRHDNYTGISWTTEKEYNMKHFVVERSDDGRVFYAINQLAARNSSHIEQYYTSDHVPLRSIAYYRLRSADAEGKDKLSRVVSVTDIIKENLLLLNNPVRKQIKLQATGQLTGIFQYQISMTNGQPVELGELVIQSNGQYEVSLKSILPPGTYILKVGNNKKSFFYKLMIL